jgi:hypothetical protein
MQPNNLFHNATRLATVAAAFIFTAWAQSSPPPTAVHGSGTPNVIPLWQAGSPSTLGDSSVSQSGNNITVNGNVTATKFFGDGSGLTNLTAASFSGGGTANINITGNAATATNATYLNGLPSSAFAQTGSNTFTGDQVIDGNLTVAGSLGVAGDTPVHSNPRMFISGLALGSLCGDITCGCPTPISSCGGSLDAGFLVPDKDVMVTRVTVVTESPVDGSCGTQPSFEIDSWPQAPQGFQNLGTTLYTLHLSNPLPVPHPGYGPGFYDSGPLSVKIAAGTDVLLVFNATSGNCTVGTSGGGNAMVNVQYAMK